MYLGNPSLPLKVSVKSAVSSAEKVLSERNWVDFKKSKTKLILIPYFYFSYHYFKEKIVNDEKIIESSVDGVLALNGVTIKIDKEFSEIIFKNLKDITSEAPNIDFEKIDDKLEKKELDDVIKLKIAEYFHVPKPNIVLSKIKKIYFPLYEFIFLVNEKELLFKINPIDGKIINLDEIPMREKSFSEITKETLEELSDPKVWVKYTKEILFKTGSVFSEKVKKEEKKIVKDPKKIKPDFSIFSSKLSWFLIILLALFLIYLALFF